MPMTTRGRTHDLPLWRLADKMLEHLFRHFEVCDNTVLHRTDRDDITRRAAEHLLGIASNSLYLICDLVDTRLSTVR
jgi:hypothetical protein